MASLAIGNAMMATCVQEPLFNINCDTLLEVSHMILTDPFFFVVGMHVLPVSIAHFLVVFLLLVLPMSIAHFDNLKICMRASVISLVTCLHVCMFLHGRGPKSSV